MPPIGIYFSSWKTKWTSNSEDMDLANIDANIVYLAFCKPSCQYESRFSFAGTGLDFNQDFSVVVGAIDIIRQRGTKVMLSVGGGSYHDWGNIEYGAIKRLVNDLHCDGIDIDWEPSDGDAEKWIPIIDDFYDLVGSGLLSAAVFSTGAYGAEAGNKYKGLNIPGMIASGEKLDWLNIMVGKKN